MLSKEKVESLKNYARELSNKLAAPVPAKHVGHPETYKQYLERELKTVSAQLEQTRLEQGGK